MLHSALKYFGILAIMGFALSKTGGFTPMVENMPDFYWTWDGNIGASTIFAWLIGRQKKNATQVERLADFTSLVEEMA